LWVLKGVCPPLYPMIFLMDLQESRKCLLEKLRNLQIRRKFSGLYISDMLKAYNLRWIQRSRNSVTLVVLRVRRVPYDIVLQAPIHENWIISGPFWCLTFSSQFLYIAFKFKFIIKWYHFVFFHVILCSYCLNIL